MSVVLDIGICKSQMKLYLETVIFLNLVAEADQRIRLTKRVEYMERSASSGVCPMRKDQRRKRSYIMSSPGSKERDSNRSC